MRQYACSDNHFGGANSNKYFDRPFRDLNHATKRMIGEWNMRVKPDDIVWYIGDFLSKGKERGVEGLRLKPQDYEAQLNGRIIHVLGNHDSNNGMKWGLEMGIIEFGGFRMQLQHHPPSYAPDAAFQFFNHYHVDIILCGHVHKAWKIKHFKDQKGKIIPAFNVGVDVNGFRPVRLDEIIDMLKDSFK